MLQQIVSHTPFYVWAILAFLVYRGILAARSRETAVRKLFIIPAVMLGLAMEDIGRKFGADLAVWAAWAAATGAMMLAVCTLSRARVAAGTMPDHVRLAGSWTPLALMLALFCTKYAVSIALAIQPGLGRDTMFAVLASTLFGIANGYFLGRLARDVGAWRRLPQAVVAARTA